MSTTVTPAELESWPYVEVYGCNFNKELKEMADTVTRLNLWNWFQTESPPENTGYMYWGHPNISNINNELKNNEHSGATFSFALRCMQSIAKKGFGEWRKQYDNNVPN